MRTNDWLIWTARKVASQSPGALLRRLGYPVHKGWADRRFPTPQSRQRAGLVAPSGAALRELILARRAPRWHWSEADIAAVVRSVPAERQARTIASAEALLARRFTFRGREPLTLPPGEWTPPAVGLGWISCLNRHHWFATLGFAYRYSRDVRFLEAFVAESTNWMDHHLPRLGGLEWDNPFEVASRINAWIWAHFLLASAPQCDAAHCERFLGGLGLLAEYLHQTIEYHSPGNHVLLEAKALVTIGEVFPEFHGAAAWRRKGWRILRHELSQQICGDGVHAERSTMYHRIIAGELAELWLFCRRNDHAEAGALEPLAHRMAEFQRWIDQGAGALPLFSDAHAEDTYCRFAAPAVVLGLPADDEATDHTCWLLAERSTEEPPTPERTSPLPTARAFREGGYFVARSGWAADADVLVWDCGPAGYQHNRKHAHLDTLSFTLSIAGTPVLIDPGKGTGQRHEALRGTRAHTTVCIDGAEQGELAARDEIFLAPRAVLDLWASSPECVVMSGRHDGYRRLPYPVWHGRTIVVMHGLYWLIVDHLEGAGHHVAEQRFHFAPGVPVTALAGSAGVVAGAGAAQLTLQWAAAGCSGLSVRCEPAIAEQRFGRPEATTLVAAVCSGSVPLAIAAAGAAGGRRVGVRWTGDAGRCVVVEGNGFAHQVDFTGGGQFALPGGWSSDAAIVIGRGAQSGAPHDVLLIGATQVERAGEARGAAATYSGDGAITRLVLD